MLSFMVTVLIVLVFLIFIGDITRTNKRKREWDEMWIEYYENENQKLRERLVVAKNRPDLNHSHKKALYSLLQKEIKHLNEERDKWKQSRVYTGGDVERVQTKLSDIDQMIDYYENIQSKLV